MHHLKYVSDKNMGGGGIWWAGTKINNFNNYKQTQKKGPEANKRKPETAN